MQLPELAVFLLDRQKALQVVQLVLAQRRALEAGLRAQPVVAAVDCKRNQEGRFEPAVVPGHHCAVVGWVGVGPKAGWEGPPQVVPTALGTAAKSELDTAAAAPIQVLVRASGV